MNILICSQYGEVQVDEVSEKLREQGMNPVILERYRKDQFIAFQYDQGKATASIKIQGVRYALNSETFPVVWYRPKPILLGELPGESASVEERFCIQEWRAIIRSLDIFLKNSKWMNPIWGSQIASSKAYQLQLASELGLQIPQTIITNDAAAALKLFQSERVIYKTLSSFFTAKQAIYTNEIRYEDVVSQHEAIAMAPGIFQNYINKKYELRITVVGQRLFVVRINSQKRSDTAIDWRRNPDPELYEIGSLSVATQEKLLQFHNRLGLIYAAYDFIVDLDGNEVFLECNPSGQWLWLENVLGLEISQMVADELMLLSTYSSRESLSQDGMRIPLSANCKDRAVHPVER
jgi:hypothetical protein